MDSRLHHPVRLDNSENDKETDEANEDELLLLIELGRHDQLVLFERLGHVLRELVDLTGQLVHISCHVGQLRTKGDVDLIGDRVRQQFKVTSRSHLAIAGVVMRLVLYMKSLSLISHTNCQMKTFKQQIHIFRGTTSRKTQMSHNRLEHL